MNLNHSGSRLPLVHQTFMSLKCCALLNIDNWKQSCHWCHRHQSPCFTVDMFQQVTKPRFSWNLHYSIGVVPCCRIRTSLFGMLLRRRECIDCEVTKVKWLKRDSCRNAMCLLAGLLLFEGQGVSMLLLWYLQLK